MLATDEAAQQAAYRLAARELKLGYQFKALHCYANDKGEALFWRIRLGHPQNGEKWIRPMHHDGKDFRMGEPTFTQGKPLYNLPALAHQDGQTVMIVEGELCVDTLRTIGVLATTSGAADSAAAADWRILGGRQVVIWPDNDEAGMRYAQQVGTLLQDLACQVRLVDIAALRLPAKGDVVNWWHLHQQATPQQIASLPTLEFSRKGDISKSTAALSASPNHLPTWGQVGKIEAELLPVPAFDINNLLPEVLRKWVQDEAERISCPISFVAVSGLVALGAVIGANCAIKPKNKDSWCVVPNLWGAIIGPPSSAKTPAISAAFVPLKALEDTACAYFQRQLAEYDVVQIVQDAQQAAIVASIKTNAKKETKPKSSKPQKAHAAESEEVQTEEENKQETLAELSAQLKNHRGQEAARPILKRFTTNDSTIEKLGELLRDNPAGLLVTRDEVTGLLSTWDKEGREADRAFYLEAWNGTSSFNTDRIQRGHIHIPNLCLSVFGAMQPDILIKYLEQTANSLQNDGMLQRFQMLVYPDECLWQWSNRAPNAAAAQDVANLFQRLATLQALKLGAENQAEKQGQPYFCFDDAAQDFFQQWMTNFRNKTIPQCDHPLIAQHLSKYPKLFAALALIFHLVDCLTNQTRGKVGINSAKRAAAWCAFLEAHARRCYGLLLDDGLRAAQALAAKIKQGELQDGFTARDINRKQWRNLCTYEAIQAALEWLEDDHWLRHEESGGIGPGSGRRAVRFYINPSITQAQRKPVAGDA